MLEILYQDQALVVCVKPFRAVSYTHLTLPTNSRV